MIRHNKLLRVIYLTDAHMRTLHGESGTWADCKCLLDLLKRMAHGARPRHDEADGRILRY